ncbi:MAG TPA: hypothetical protein VLW53_06945 [Candidatus Eisenbacteria bacterium]|nr:hypothetical protein [Candidatus Eisenbacteria bacterium]
MSEDGRGSATRDGRTAARLRPMGWEPYEGPRSLRRMPGLLTGAVRLMWEAAPGLTLIFLGLQVISAAAAGPSLLVVRSLVRACRSAPVVAGGCYVA